MTDQERIAKYGINVFSFFDGVSAGQEALRQLGVKVANYYAIEIDESAIKVTMHNFPNTIQKGDILALENKEREFINSLPEIDLVFAGSPCQGFSKAGNKEGLRHKNSRLFFNFYKILQVININRKKNRKPPVPFFFENVEMSKEHSSELSKYLGVDYHYLDAKDYSPCARPRFYWTNLNIPQTMILKYESNATAQTLMGDANGMIPKERVFSYPSFWVKKPKYRKKQKDMVKILGTDANSFCLVGVPDDSNSGGDGWALQRFSDGKLPCFKTNNNGFHWGLGVVGVHESLINGKHFQKTTSRQIADVIKNTPSAKSAGLKVGKSYPIVVNLKKTDAIRLGMQPGKYYAVRPTTREGEVALGFPPGYCTNVPKVGDKRTVVTRFLGNSWSVTVVKLLIESYCTRMGWVRGVNK